ncbi:collagen-like protein [Lactiplantibacillus argentoratensis]|uniref:collagen-like protein n=1 Tax=Lactiplantibacillus argentoratensis TaxID=271881 RepID=UPI001C0F5A7E|nr:collagen-like protein [Lactiplantibacillus argentoratensis]MBU5277279.1 collagen-like protein [Lactiplantibacillus argentoratensis]
MAKTLSFTDTSPQTVKIGDTTTSFTLICGNDNVATDLTKATSISVKLGNASGYLKSATIDPASLTDPTTGQVTVNFNADLMTSLTAGSYSIEVWVVDNTGTSIYPSDGSTGFTITNNIQSANGSTITTITFDDFVEAMNKAASTIAKGDKGDTGTVDNTGLISAPAFQSLQTQVNNSAVGTNLLMGTSGALKAYSGNSWSSGNLSSTTISLISGQTYTARMWIQGYDVPTDLAMRAYDAGGSQLAYAVGNVISANSSGYSTVTWTADSKWTSNVIITLSFTSQQSATHSGQYSELKLEKGIVATDWCLNPTEILTQSDYAKIKAAIVALGGALS